MTTELKTAVESKLKRNHFKAFLVCFLEGCHRACFENGESVQNWGRPCSYGLHAGVIIIVPPLENPNLC